MTKRAQIGGSTYSEVYYNIWNTVGAIPYFCKDESLQSINIQGFSGEVKYNKIYNNLMFNTENSSIIISNRDVDYTVEGNEIFNNIIYGFRTFAILIGKYVDKNIIKNNLIFSTRSIKSKPFKNRGQLNNITEFNDESNQQNEDDFSGNIYSDPKFEDVDNYIFNLLKDSIAIDKGLPNDQIYDYVSNLIKDNPDIGPLEYYPKKNNNINNNDDYWELVITVVTIGILTLFPIILIIFILIFLFFVLKKKKKTKFAGSQSGQSELVDVDELDIMEE